MNRRRSSAIERQHDGHVQEWERRRAVAKARGEMTIFDVLPDQVRREFNFAASVPASGMRQVVALAAQGYTETQLAALIRRSCRPDGLAHRGRGIQPVQV